MCSFILGQHLTGGSHGMGFLPVRVGGRATACVEEEACDDASHDQRNQHGLVIDVVNRVGHFVPVVPGSRAKNETWPFTAQNCMRSHPTFCGAAGAYRAVRLAWTAGASRTWPLPGFDIFLMILMLPLVVPTLLTALYGVQGSLSTPLPEAAVSLIESGLSAQSEGDTALAVRSLEAALELVPENAPTLINLGLIWDANGLYIQAIDCFSRAIDTDPAAAVAYQHYGRILFEELNERDLGEEALRTCVAIKPERAEGWARLGRVLQSRGALEEAHQALGKAVALAPASVDDRRNLATVQRATGRFEEALASLLAAADITAQSAAAAPSSDEVDAALGEALRESTRLRAHGMFDEAKHLLQAATRVTVAMSGDSFFDQALAFAPPGLVARCAGKGVCDAPSGDADVGTTATTEAKGILAAKANLAALPAQMPAEWASRLSAVHRTPVATSDECAWVITAADAHAIERGGWSMDGHHDAHPTTDILVSESEALREWLRSKLERVITPALCAQFHLTPDQIWLEDAFIIKYEATEGGQPGLGFHRDDSELSFNILLSDPGAFQGGGTSFELDGIEDGLTRTVEPERGDMISHYGGLRHSGREVTEGTRYLLAGFVRTQPLAAEWERLRYDK